MAAIHPTEVKYLEEKGQLVITFSDDYVAEFNTAFLRGYCPCAHCQGHGAGPSKWNAIKTPAATRVENVTPVGNYGMCIVWADGHDTGIHSFKRLRNLPVDPDFDPSALSEGDELIYEETV